MSSRSVPVSASLRSAVEEKVAKLGRFLDGMERAEVHFAEQPTRRNADGEQCEVTLHGHGRHVRAKVSAPDCFAAVDAAVVKLEQQLRTLKSKLVARQHGRRRVGADVGAPGGVPAPADGRKGSGRRSGPDGLGPSRNGSGDRSADGVDDGLERFPLVVRLDDEPRIVKTKRFALKPMAPEEAILQMELLSHRFFFFTNAHTGLASVVYVRDDGDIGLIEPAR